MLGADLPADERDKATAAWAEAMGQEIQFVDQQRSGDSNLANNLTLLELPNFLMALEHLAKWESADEITTLATRLESLVSALNRPKMLARIVEIRSSLSHALSERSHARYLSEDVDRLIDQGRYAEAVRAARARS